MTAKRDKDYAKNKSNTDLIMTSNVSVSGNKNVSNFVSSTQNVTSTQENLKRTNKPLMEKRRRARINQSLAILKALILESTKANPRNGTDGTQTTKHTKLEKADILELTVRHFQRHRNLDDPAINKYRAGYTDCAREVARYLATPEPPPLPTTPTLSDPGSKARLLRHLDQCIAEIDFEICPPATTAHADSPSSSCFDITCSTKTQNNENLIEEYCNDESNPLDFSKNTRTQLCISSRNDQPTSTTNVNLVEDENNNHGNDEAATFINERSNLDEQSSDVGETSGQQNLLDIIRNKNTFSKEADGNSILVVPPHYVQLAAALGLSAQSALDTNIGIKTDTNFEHLIGLTTKSSSHSINEICQKSTPETNTLGTVNKNNFNNGDTIEMDESNGYGRNLKMEIETIGQEATTIISSSSASSLQSLSGFRCDYLQFSGNSKLLQQNSSKPVMTMSEDEILRQNENENNEQNQNNQNIPNQQQAESKPFDENMWRPW